MILSRFWYAALAMVAGASVFVLFAAVELFNRSSQRNMAESLSADATSVQWFLREDSRKRSSELIKFALHPDLRTQLHKATTAEKIPNDIRNQSREVLFKVSSDVSADTKFDALWAVDANGRVVASHIPAGLSHEENWELGGYPLVADALHGWIRDDAWVWKGRIYRVVARPVELETASDPVGAIIGAKIVDDDFAKNVSARTHAAVGFFADGVRVASGAPEDFDKANLDLITQDLKDLEANQDYKEKGRSDIRLLAQQLGVIYSRLPGEAWELGAGYAVGRSASLIASPMDFVNRMNNTDKSRIPTTQIILVTILMCFLGLFFSYFEHTAPLRAFRLQVENFKTGKLTALSPGKLRGTYRKIATDLNDGVEASVVKAGGAKRAADLQEVFGQLPQQPVMSAFSVPGVTVDNTSLRPPSSVRNSGPKGQTFDFASDSDSDIGTEEVDPVSGPPKPPPRKKHTTVESVPTEELQEWKKIYDEFVELKKKCGESVTGFTFEKFQSTLQRNKEALMNRSGTTGVKFTVYMKDGKAALKASPLK